MVSFLFLMKTSAFAEDCVQKRTSIQAPDSIYKQVNPFASSPETIAAG